jgi:hypothetical protein
MSVANSPSLDSSSLRAVSCASDTSCVAVGTSGSQTLTEVFDGTQWSDTLTPDVGTPTGVSCSSPTSCVAVGFADAGLRLLTFIEVWNGTTWTVMRSPNPPNSAGPRRDELEGVSCVGATICTAVGDFYDGAVSRTLVETWNGIRWSIAPSVNAAAGGSNLVAVSCLTARSCAAVGSSNGSAASLVETWDGTRWVVAQSADPGLTGNVLAGVVCASGSGCLAAGYSTNGELARTVVLSP